ncbi:hypothetical protein CSW98_10005 [Vibrio sp. HA2012]|nr:hypothetical protein CSW98_10005 [Vibrio sp. HA2012]
MAKYGIKRAKSKVCSLLTAKQVFGGKQFIFKSHTYRHMFRGASAVKAVMTAGGKSDAWGMWRPNPIRGF